MRSSEMKGPAQGEGFVAYGMMWLAVRKSSYHSA